MKFSSTLISLIATQALAADSALEAECGALGIATWTLTNLPPNTSPSKLRKCKEHPLSTNLITPRNTEAVNGFEERACKPSLFRRQYGCERGWCWSNCGSASERLRGKWCWLAWNNGKGKWTKCGNLGDCEFAMRGDASCGVGDCKACGCSC